MAGVHQVSARSVAGTAQRRAAQGCQEAAAAHGRRIKKRLQLLPRLEVEVVHPQRALQQDDGALGVAQRLRRRAGGRPQHGRRTLRAPARRHGCNSRRSTAKCGRPARAQETASDAGLPTAAQAPTSFGRLSAEAAAQMLRWVLLRFCTEPPMDSSRASAFCRYCGRGRSGQGNAPTEGVQGTCTAGMERAWRPVPAAAAALGDAAQRAGRPRALCTHLQRHLRHVAPLEQAPKVVVGDGLHRGSAGQHLRIL